jgi:hypothetical protein
MLGSERAGYGGLRNLSNEDLLKFAPPKTRIQSADFENFKKGMICAFQVHKLILKQAIIE